MSSDGDDDPDDTDLGDFGGGATRDPPRVRKRKAINMKLAGELKHPGHLVEIVTPDRAAQPAIGFLTTRDSHDHRIRYLKQDAGGAYGVSRGVISEVNEMAHRLLGADRIQSFFVAETDTGDVYEWRMDRLERAPAVPEQYLETKRDPQVYLTRDSAEYVWDDIHPDDFYVPRGGRQRGGD